MGTNLILVFWAGIISLNNFISFLSPSLHKEPEKNQYFTLAHLIKYYIMTGLFISENEHWSNVFQQLLSRLRTTFPLYYILYYDGIVSLLPISSDWYF